MSTTILYCTVCHTYTLQEKCPKCSTPTHEPRPPKYTPEDKYGSYRRQEKKKELQEKGLY